MLTRKALRCIQQGARRVPGIGGAASTRVSQGTRALFRRLIPREEALDAELQTPEPTESSSAAPAASNARALSHLIAECSEALANIL
jgi:hypothetical protein